MNAQSMRRQLKKEIEDKELTPFSINKGGKNKASTFLEDTQKTNELKQGCPLYDFRKPFLYIRNIGLSTFFGPKKKRHESFIPKDSKNMGKKTRRQGQGAKITVFISPGEIQQTQEAKENQTCLLFLILYVTQTSFTKTRRKPFAESDNVRYDICKSK